MFIYKSVKDERFVGDERINILRNNNAYTGYYFQKAYDGMFSMSPAIGWKQCNLSTRDMRELLKKLEELNKDATRGKMNDE